MIRVRDIMTPHVISLPADGRVENAVWSLNANQISGAPVRDAEGKVLGVLSKSDLVDSLRHRPVDGETPITEAMTPEVWSIHPDSAASAAVELMVDKHIHRLVVMETTDEIIGIVTSMDILRALLAGMDLRPRPDESGRLSPPKRIRSVD